MRQRRDCAAALRIARAGVAPPRGKKEGLAWVTSGCHVVLAFKTLKREDALAASRAARVLSARLRRDGQGRRQVADASTLQGFTMTTHVIAEMLSPAYSNAFGSTLSLEDLRHHTPAVFAESASERTRATYRFINLCGRTHKLINVANAHMWRACRERRYCFVLGNSTPHNRRDQSRGSDPISRCS